MLWSYKFTSENWFEQKIVLKRWFKWQKVENYKLKKLSKKLIPHLKMDKKIIKFDETKIEEYKFH